MNNNTTVFQYMTYHNQQLEETLKTSIKSGLTAEEVEEKLKQFGYNEVPDVPPSILHFIVRQCRSPFLFVLLLAAGLAFFLHDVPTTIMIVIIFLVNVVVGSYQEYKADRSVRLLKALLRTTARVIRAGQESIIQKRDVVPGDLVVLDPGAIVPADLRLVQAEELTIDESMLTGEAVPALKDSTVAQQVEKEVPQAKNCAFAGTTVVAGRAVGVVVNTGIHTVQGAIGKLAGEIVPESIFSEDIARFTRILLIFIFGLFLLVIMVHLLWGHTQAHPFDVILFVLALAISVTPEALPVVILFSLSRSARKLAEKKVIVKRLSAVNDLGAVQILCVDKTGTLTENHMTVAAWHTDNEENFFIMAALASEQANVHGTNAHSLDAALWHHFTDEVRDQAKSYTIVRHIPFNPVQRSNEVIVKKDGKEIEILRGALEVVVQECALPKNDPVFVWATQEGQAGRRVLAVATKSGSIFEFLGAVSFTDPIKKTVKPALEKAKELDVHIKVITGDAKDVATAVALQSGVIKQGEQVLLGQEFAALSAEEAVTAAQKYNVFARVTPEQKYHIIQALQKTAAVGFLGDGINDVLALKAAHVGITVQGCADIAREAADIVLLKKSLLAIIDGIQLGRESVSNTKKYITAVLASNFGNASSIAFGSFIVTFLPLAPIQVLALNLISDFPMLCIAADAVDPEELVKPARFDMQRLFIVVVILGWTSSIFDFMIFYIFSHQSPAELQSYWFVGSMLTEVFFIMSIRTRKFFLFAKAPAKLLIFSILVSSTIAFILPNIYFGQHFFKFVPLAWWGIKMVLIIVVAYLVTTECVKIVLYRYLDKVHKFVASIHS